MLGGPFEPKVASAHGPWRQGALAGQAGIGGPHPFPVVDGPATDPGEAAKCSVFKPGESLARFRERPGPNPPRDCRRILTRLLVPAKGPDHLCCRR